MSPSRQLPSAAPEDRDGIFLQRDHLLEHLQGVAVHVKVVVVALGHAAQRLQLGQHNRGRAHLAHQLQARNRAGRIDDAAQLHEDPLRRDLAKRRRMRSRAGARVAVRFEIELHGKPHEAQHAQRILGERTWPGLAQPPPREVLQAAERIDSDRAGDWNAPPRRAPPAARRSR